jgi:hypothetical protein
MVVENINQMNWKIVVTTMAYHNKMMLPNRRIEHWSKVFIVWYNLWVSPKK